MPVIRSTRGTQGAARGVAPVLWARLAEELLGRQGPPGGPLIFEIPADVDDRVDAYVIWDAWEALPPAHRTETIEAAYQHSSALIENTYRLLGHKGERDATTVRMAVGATRAEALAMGMLPYTVIPREGSVVPDDELRAYIRSQGGLDGPDGLHLRFPNEQFAQEAVERLSREVPEVHWEVVQQPAIALD